MLGNKRNFLGVIAIVLLLIAAHARVSYGSSQHRKDRRVIIIIGSARSRAVYSALEAAGVWMHPETDRELNSRLFAEKVLKPWAASFAGNTSLSNVTGLYWNRREKPDDFYRHVLLPEAAANLAAWHREFAAAMQQRVPDDAQVWGWKHPYALYMLPFVIQAFPTAHIIHQVQDGRHQALGHLLAGRTQHGISPYKRIIINLTTGKDFALPEQRSGTEYSLAMGQVWALSNTRALGWAGERGLGMHGRHSTVRLEDLCNLAEMQGAIKAMLRNAQLPEDDVAVTRAVDSVKACRCPNALWQEAWSNPKPEVTNAARAIEAEMAFALEAFGYQVNTALELPGWMEASTAMQQLAEAGKAAAGGKGPLILTFVSNGYERVVSNWIAWLQSSNVDMSKVMIVARGNSYSAVNQAVAGTGVTTFSLPVLSPSNSPGLDDRGRRVDSFKNVRAGVWLERVRCVQELIQHNIAVLLTDLDAIWTQNPLPYIKALADGQQKGYDIVASRGYFPSQAYKAFKVAGCMGFVYINATQPAQAFMQSMLREKLRQLSINHVRYYNDQRVMNTLLVQADLAYNATVANQAFALQNTTLTWGEQITTSPMHLRAAFLPEALIQRTCDNNVTNNNALVVHCQSPKSGIEKEAFLKTLKLWKQ